MRKRRDLELAVPVEITPELCLADLRFRGYGMTSDRPVEAAVDLRDEWKRLDAAAVPLPQRVAEITAYAAAAGLPCRFAQHALRASLNQPTST